MGMEFFSDDPCSVVSPREMVLAFDLPGKTLPAELSLERLALVAFTAADLQGLIGGSREAKPVEAWRNRARHVHRGEGWVAVRAPCGAPGTVMLLEELTAFGMKRALFLGYCGSLQKEIGVGAVVLPVEAIREEGTSYHYLPKGQKSCPDLALQEKLLHWMEEVGLSPFRGTVWTTDAPYRETADKVRRYGESGVLGVEMEMAAAFAFGKAREISIGAVLIVSDEVGERGWRAGFFSAEVQSTRKKVTEVVLSHLPEIGGLP